MLRASGFARAAKNDILFWTMTPQPKKRPAQSQKHTVDEEQAADYGKRLWYAVGFFCAIIVFAVSVYVVRLYSATSWEQAGFSLVNDLSNRLYYPAAAFTALGSTWMAVATVGMTYLLRLYWLSWRLAFSIMIGYGAVYGVKVLIDRPRPENLLDSAITRTVEAWPGLPSGHAMLITVIMLTLFPYLPRFWRWIFIPGVVAAVGLSRIYLGEHMPLDVIAGVAVGAMIVCFIRILPQSVRIRLRLG